MDSNVDKTSVALIALQQLSHSLKTFHYFTLIKGITFLNLDINVMLVSPLGISRMNQNKPKSALDACLGHQAKENLKIIRALMQ